MGMLGLNDVKTGKKIIHNGDPWIITEADFVKPGKGQAFTRIRIRNLKDGRTTEQTLKSSDSYEEADAVDTDAHFSYVEGTGNDREWIFMQSETFEQHRASLAAMGDAWKWLKGEEECVVTLFNGNIIAVQAPKFVELKITETDPGVRGDTSGGGGKPATLETGAVVRVPLFVNQDEVIKVDTRTGEYDSRVK
ncbi:elongation factor P [Luteibacter rhizovicinus DSM 16549]|jgi:elongation factor P|uniref:Elongation factor P n=1 Tax=Luteibacter rhizovicinus DSM 16549 TaxID=1440763 RepID=A0A1L3ENN0_9GAMM|nr:elongation factor P [Luteibacter rhizovicinus]APG02577.1 elongation factor P [Luteibacter rhizovicinus DSM 16549]KLD73630.1 elongation factor P [Xanthomonas hyacinthi DSM 19077]